MRLSNNARWGLAFADLSLLMLGFMVLQKIQPAEQTPQYGAETHVEQVTLKTGNLFHSGEAMLSKAGRKLVDEHAAKISAHSYALTISVLGRGPSSSRLDEWELSAARMASVARRLEKAGVASTRISFGSDASSGQNIPQEIVLTFSPSGFDE